MASASGVTSPSKAKPGTSRAARDPTLVEIREELVTRIKKKTVIVEIEDFLNDYMPAPHGHTPATNVFKKAPAFSNEKDLYKYAIRHLKKADCPGHTFCVTAYKADPVDPTKQVVDWGMYKTLLAPKKEFTASGHESSRMAWRFVGLAMEGKVDKTSDPFDDATGEAESSKKRRAALGQLLSYAELIFKYQQRLFVFMVIMLGDCARIVRIDRSGIIASKLFQYDNTDWLTEFVSRYARQTDAVRGYDPSAHEIEHTSELGLALKKYGAEKANLKADDKLVPPHVPRLFNRSLDEGWAWWKLCVEVEKHGDSESGTEIRWFAVGRPHFEAGGVIGRGTRGYIAVPLNAGGSKIDETSFAFVYLKDAWRVSHEGIEKEGTVLATLNAKEVRCVPTLVCHGDLSNQTTESYNRWSQGEKGERVLKSNQHYRIVVEEIGKPLSEFRNGFELVFAIFCCIIAHSDACLKAGYIHRDVSAGNILLHKSKSGAWTGLLNDWEMSKAWKDGKTAIGRRQLDRTGTWQFMSVRTLLDSEATTEITDDFESFLHVMVYYSARFLPNNIPDGLVGIFLHNYFDDYSEGAHGLNCGAQKLSALSHGTISISEITGRSITTLGFYRRESSTEPHLINGLLSDLLESFQAFYTKFSKIPPVGRGVEERERTALHPEIENMIQLGSDDHSDTTSRPQGPPVVDLSLSDTVESHKGILALFSQHLKLQWPDNDKGRDKKPASKYDVRNPGNDASSMLSGMKRPAEEQDTKSQKRSRMDTE